jgi:GntR family transcriptional repressor for pyruvate dehydrogenase complex
MSSLSNNNVDPGNGTRSSLVARVHNQWTQEILSGRLGPDAPLPSEGGLALSLGVSRTVVREAMRTLREQGLIEMSQGRAARVKSVSAQATIASLDALLRRSDGTAASLVEVRRPLEGEAAALAAERASREQIEEMLNAIQAMDRAVGLEQQVDADLNFHYCLARAAGNPAFYLLLETLAGLMRQTRRTTLSKTGVDAANSAHRAVLAAIVRRDPVAARAEMLDHLDHAWRDLDPA